MGKKLGYVSLGCAKNLVDTEVMLGLLKDNGYTITEDLSEADLIVVFLRWLNIKMMVNVKALL